MLSVPSEATRNSERDVLDKQRVILGRGHG